MQKERRNVYRVEVPDDDPIKADMVGSSGRAVGEVFDVSLKGAGVVVSLDQEPTFAIGEKVQLRLESKLIGLVELAATIHSRLEQDGSRRFGLAFTEEATSKGGTWLTLRARLSARLLRLFNERRSPRVEPSPDAPADVCVRAGDLQTTGRVLDLSVDGIGVAIDTEAEKHLSSIVDVDLKLQLPGQNAAITFKASIRSRAKVEGKGDVYYGLCFDPESSPDFLEQQRHVADYVRVRQRELLETSVETTGDVGVRKVVDGA